MSIFNDLNTIGNKLQQLDAKSSRSKSIRDPVGVPAESPKKIPVTPAGQEEAGYFIGGNLNNRVSNVEQMLENLEYARYILDILDPTLEDILDKLMEIKEYAAQAANPELNPLSRETAAEQIAKLADEINERAGKTSLQGISLLSGEQKDGVSTHKGHLELRFSLGEDDRDVLSVRLEAMNIQSLYEGSRALSMDQG
ncbi:hypothetical protein QLX67_13960, partial [Balneolaceae bacterium ANBcel3]|nr:hypothetical protein [Balneolaceae bacterium ANBcel3]